MKNQVVGRHADVTLIQGIGEQPLHGLHFRFCWRAADGGFESHGGDAQHRVRYERGDIWAKRHFFEMAQVVGRIVPGHLVDAFLQRGLGHVLDARETIDDGAVAVFFLLAEGGADGAIADDDGGRAVPYGLRQAGVDFDF